LFTFSAVARCSFSAISTEMADPLLPEFGRRASAISRKPGPVCATMPLWLASQ